MRMRPLVAVVALIAVAGCSGQSRSGSDNAATSAVPQINGAGATFPNPIYSKWFADYNTLHPNVRINYQPIGSGGGIRQLTNRTVFFGASDMPMSQEQLQALPAPVLHVPTVLGAVVPVYNLSGVTHLRLSGPVLASIYLGKIRTWNDPAIAKVNPGVSLPPSEITVVHRSEASGTTFIFVDYLGKVSTEFHNSVGANTAVSWPTGVGGKGNEGVTGLVSQTPGAIGYVELIYALQNKISYADVQNAAGEFVKGAPGSVTRAAEGATVPEDFRVSITNPPGAGAYPISSFTWLLLYQDPPDKAQARAMNDFLKWALSDGQKYATELGYAPLPPSVAAQALKALEKIKTS